MAARFERSARFWMRAYPRRWRAVRGEELLGVLSDLAAPGARSVGLRTALDLVRGGWLTRWRGRPPVGPWLGYRLLDVTFNQDHRGWVADDIDGAGYPLRSGGIAPLLLVIALPQLLSPTLRSGLTLTIVALAVVLHVALRGRTRRLARERHLVGRAGDPVTVGMLVLVDAPCRRVSARSAMPRVLTGLVVCWVASTWGALSAPTLMGQERVPSEPGSIAWDSVEVPVGGWRVVVAVVLVAALTGGLLGAVGMARRLGRVVASVGAQPYRNVTPATRDGQVLWVCLVGVVVLDAWAEGTGRMVLLATPFVAAVTAVLVPIVVAAMPVVVREARDRPAGRAVLALTDVRWIGWHGTPPPVDGTVTGVAPLTGPVHPGAVLIARPALPPATARRV